MDGFALDSIKANVGETVTLPKTERYGYRFDGWYTSSSLTTKVDETVTLTQNVTYYAKWTEVKYLYLYYNYDNTYERLEFAPNANVTVSSLGTPEDYVKRNTNCPFVRWTTQNGTTATDFTITAHTVLIAEYDTTKVPVAKYIVDNGNGTWSTTKEGKQVWIFQNTEKNTGVYSFDMTMIKGANGAPGIAFRMTLSGKDYSFEENGTSYIAAVLVPSSGALDVSKVIGGSWSRIKQTDLTALPSAWQTKFNNATSGSSITVNLKVISYSDGFDIYIDNTLAYTYTDSNSVLSSFTGTGWGMRSSTTDQVVTFANVSSYSAELPYKNNLTNNGNGTYTTGSSTIAMLQTATSQTLTYSGTFAIVKGNGGGVGLAFRMKMNGTVMYPYETPGTQYLSAVLCPGTKESPSGALQVSMVDGDLITYENSNLNKFFQLRGENKNGKEDLSPVALADLPTNWQNKYNNAVNGDTITATLKVIDYGNKIEVYIDNELSFTSSDAILSHFTGTGLGIRSSSSGATISNLSHTINK